MESQYDIFEILPDGAPIWKGTAEGQDAALARLKLLGETCDNELIVVHLPSSRVVARKGAGPMSIAITPDSNGNGSDATSKKAAPN